MNFFLKFFLLLILLIVGGLTYLGFMPVLSPLLGADKPKDLGITFTQADFDTVVAREGLTYKALPTETDLMQSAQYEGSHEVNLVYTSTDLTAKINASNWKFNPFTNVQIRINPDGTTEISGNVSLAKLWDYATTVGVSASDIEKAKQALVTIPSQPAFYAKGTVEASENKISHLNLDSLSIGRLSVPQSIIQPNQHYLTEMANKEMNSIPGFYAKSVKAENGEIKFEGSLPDVEAIVMK